MHHIVSFPPPDALLYVQLLSYEILTLASIAVVARPRQHKYSRVPRLRANFEAPDGQKERFFGD